VTTLSQRPFPTQVRNKRGLGGCLLQVIAIFAIGGVLFLAITAAFAPWGFFLGGKFHIFPYWQGWGTFHARTGDYPLFVSFHPAPGGKGTHGGSWVEGNGFLCTPRGERFYMHVGGKMRRPLRLSTDGEAINVWMYNWPPGRGGFIADHRPELNLEGHWQNPNLVLNDGGSIARSFGPDGSVYRGGDPNHPYSKDPIMITLTPGPQAEFEAACKAAKK